MKCKTDGCSARGDMNYRSSVRGYMNSRINGNSDSGDINCRINGISARGDFNSKMNGSSTREI